MTFLKLFRKIKSGSVIVGGLSIRTPLKMDMQVIKALGL